MDSFQIGQLVVVCIYAYGEEEARVASVDELVVSELRCTLADQTRGQRGTKFVLRTSTKLLWYFESRGAIKRWTSPRIRAFSSSSYGSKPLNRRVCD